jgi:rhomboid protease
MEGAVNIELDDKNVIVMKLLHYFITEKNYNPIILQGAENEIWLENMDEDYKIVRIVSNYIHNDEQFRFDMFKTKRIVKKIQKKTFSLHVNTLSFFLDLGDNVNLFSSKDLENVNVQDEEDITSSDVVKDYYPDLSKKLVFNEDGVQLFMKISDDISKHNKVDAEHIESVFKMKYPIVTYLLIALNVILYVIPVLTNSYDVIINNFCVYGPLIKAGQYYRIITGVFLHGGILHLAFNCYALYVIGSQLESYLGKVRYLIIYLFSAVTASLFSMIFNSNPSIGASGAIFGLMGALVYFGYHYRVYLGNVLKSQIIPLILFNLLIGALSTGIDNFAHIGGLIGGLLITSALGIKYKSSTSQMVNGWILSVIYLGFIIFMAFFYTV